MARRDAAPTRAAHRSSSCWRPRRSSSPAARAAWARPPPPRPPAAMAAAHLGGKVLVLTVDPARRLANALGLERFGNVETPGAARRCSPTPASSPGASCGRRCSTPSSRGTTSCARHAPDAATRDAILANPLYQNITGRFVQSHDYIAMERLYEIHASGRYDLIVVDTPPTRNAIDFLEAPERMADFFSSRLLRWLTAPARSRVLNDGVQALLHGGRPHPRLAVPRGHRRVLPAVPDDVRRLRRAGPGRRRALLADRRTTFVVVSTLEAAPVREAEFFIDALRRAAASTSARSCSTRCCPTYFLDRGAADGRRAPVPRRRRAGRRGWRGARRRRRPTRSPGCSREVGESFLNFQVVAKPRGRAARRAGVARRRAWPPCPTSTPTSPTWPACSSWASALWR